MATDEQLIQQIQKGKDDAYGQLFRRYYQQIYSICFSILRNPQDAEEVTQEAFVQAYLKLKQLKKPDKFFAWLKKIARNRSKNYARQKYPEMVPLHLASVQTAHERALVKGYIPHQIAPDEHVLKQELVDSVMEAVEALPPKDRDVVRAHIDGLNHAEISERFGISVEASMSRLYRARKKLAANVKDLLNAIFGLPRMLPVKKIISGGILAMKIGTKAKVTVGVIGLLVAGCIGFQAVTHQPDVKTPKVATQQQAARSEVRRGTVSKMNSRPNKSEKVIQDEQDLDRQIEETFAWLDSPEEESSSELDKVEVNEEAISEETISEPQQDERFFGLTKAEIEAQIPVLEEKIYTNLTKAVSLYKELKSTDEMGAIPEVAKWRTETWNEIKRLWEENFADTCRYIRYSLVIDADSFRANSPLAEGGWIHELYKPLPMRIGSGVIPTAKN